MLPLSQLPFLIPTVFQVTGLLATLAVAFSFCVLGGAIAGRDRMPEWDLLIGWGVTVALFTLGGVLLPFVSFTFWAGVFFLAAVGSAWVLYRREGCFLAPGVLRIFLLSLPLFLIIVSMVPSQWDEFSHWLHNARYLVRYDSFPRAGLPPNTGNFAAYPYALPIVTYLASRLAGGLVEMASAFLNVLLLVSFAGALIRLIRMGLGAALEPVPSWKMAAFVLVLATLAGPTFVPKIVLTNYAETSMAASLAAAALLSWQAIERISKGHRGGALRFALLAALSLLLLLNLKQSALIFLLLLIAGFVLAAWRHPMVRLSQGILPLMFLALIPLSVYLVWRWHVEQNLPYAEMVVRPFAQWNWDITGAIAANMVSVALSKSGHFGLSVALTICAAVALWRWKSAFDSLAIITAVLFVGYIGFLAITYLAVFERYEGETVASFWRYNMHLGLIVEATAVFGLARVWRAKFAERVTSRALARWGALALGIVALAPAVNAGRLRFDIRAPKLYVHAVGAELARTLPEGARLFAVDPLDTGFYMLLLNYSLDGRAQVVGYVSAFQKANAEKLKARLEILEADFVWVHTQNADSKTGLGLDLPEGASHLLARDKDGWRLVKSWPYWGYHLPTDIPD